MRLTALRTRHTTLHRQRQIAKSLECSHIETLHLYKTDKCLDGIQDLDCQYLEILPPILNLKQLVISVLDHGDNEEFYRAVGAFVAAHPGTVERLKLFLPREAFPSSLAGLVPALLRLTWLELFCGDKRHPYDANWVPILYDLSDLVGDCDSLRQFSCHMTFTNSHMHAMCHLASRFPSLKRVQLLGKTRQDKTSVSASILDMVHTSQSIEAIDGWTFGNETQKAAIGAKFRKNRIQNCMKCVRDNGVLADRIPTNLWPLILHKYSDEVEPDMKFYLLQEMHVAIISTHYTQLA